MTQLLVMQSAIIHLAITRPVCIIRENCHMIILCWPYLHATIELYTCRSTGCFTFCFLIGAMRWLSCKSAAKEVSRFDLEQRNISSLPKSDVAIQVTRRQFQTKGLSGSISSNIWLRFWVLTRSNDWASLGTACTQAKILEQVERWHKNWFWNTGNKRVNSKAGMILGFQFEENTGTLGKPTTSLFQICGHMFQAQARQLYRHLHATSTSGSSGGGKSEAMTWGFGWWL